MTVRILPSEIVSKIAAGEVIERPASVVKELLENALDAEASSIDLELEDAGKRLLRLRDTGTGIARRDIETIFHRHATSKIGTIEDLFAIRSLGFRGEALYAIAAVSDVTLVSRPADQETGWRIRMRGGERIELKPAARPAGTEVLVRDLFFNTPARRKFLKSRTTELHHILNIFLPYTLLFPERRFHLTHQGRVMIDLPETNAPLERAAAALHLERRHIHEVRRTWPDKDLSIHAILGDINISRPRRDLQFLFVNRRPVVNRSLTFHINDVYRLLLPPGAAPFFAVHIEIPPEEVDVNIHPTKREVKLRDEASVAARLRGLAEEVLLRMGTIKEVKPTEKIPTRPYGPPHPSTRGSSLELREAGPEPLPDAAPTSSVRRPTDQYAFPLHTDTPSAKTAGGSLPEYATTAGGLRARLAAARPIGVFLQTYQIFQSGRALLFIDQHAAQERITFEQLIRQMQKGSVEVQNLLSPELIRITPAERLLWEEARDILDQAGFTTSVFDEETLAVHTTPLLIKDPGRAVQEILAGGQPARRDHTELARRACRASIMAGDRISPEEADHQRRRLLACEDPFTCPHGRPTVIELTETFLKKQFLRT